jgi:Cytochrome c7 and related cytochrome c
MSRSALVGLLVLVGGLALAPAAGAQVDRCADCHIANRVEVGARHVADWDLSAHGRNNIGCAKCHGGDPTTSEVSLAHRNILSPLNPASPVNRRNLPVTCGGCHTGPLVAFQKSHHWEMLQAGDTRGPTCSTCHGEAGAWRPSPRALEAQCRQCHGPNGIAPRVERPEAARTLYEAVNDSRDLLETARRLIDRVKDPRRREDLETAYQQAQTPLTLAVESGHQFVYDDLTARLRTARERLETLLGMLANPQ